MAEEHNVQERVVQDGNFVQSRRVTEVAPPTGQVILARVKALIWLIAGVLVALLAFRFVLALLNSGRGSGFADLIYGITDIFVAPFIGITGNPTFGQGSVVDVASLFAMVVYPLIAWVLIRLLYIIFKAPPGVRHVSTYERQ
jgi:hypothetical protein